MTPSQKVVALLGTWSGPPDLPAKIALGLAVLIAVFAFAGGGRNLLLGVEVTSPRDARRIEPEKEDRVRGERRRFLAIAALAAALLSVAYVSAYLLGGPRIIDATMYFLQGRALSHGDFAWTPLEPSASFRGRFLIYREGPDGASLGGIFPPGYPLLLAFGFMLGSPMLVGPLLAGALVLATYYLARALAEETHPHLAEPIARSAALLSVLCAALRYHTADTMSHGASALGVTIALTCAVRARRPPTRATYEQPAPFDGGRGEALLAGVAIGYVFATRPASALAIAFVVGWLLARSGVDMPTRPTVGLDPMRGQAAPIRLVLFAMLGLLPGLLLFVASQRAVTGSWITSTQRMYYAISDGPPDCFRWGFGDGTGCVFEHGDFVHAHLEHGYGVVAALGTTLRRLRPHLLDVANFEPLTVLVLVPLFALRPSRDAKAPASGLPRIPTGQRAVRAATALVGLQMLAYLPFYFDGNYPGGGARFFADVLPVEHALIMIGVACIYQGRGADAPRASEGIEKTAHSFVRAALAVLSLGAAGFAVHASHEHVKLRDRDRGPMFEPDVLSRANVKSGLIFVETDHGFGLGHDPTARPSDGVVVARLLNDDRDRMLFDALDRPPTYLYRLDPPKLQSGLTTPTLTPWAPPEHGSTFHFEAEAEWPALTQQGGFAVPGWVDSCASNRRALVLTPAPTGSGHARATITVPVPSSGRWSVVVHVVNGTSIPFAPAETTATIEGGFAMGAERWAWKSATPGNGASACVTLPSKELELTAPHMVVTLDAVGGPIALDRISLRKVP